jgi:hypothetical protein
MTLIIEKPTTSKLILAKDYVGIDDPDAAVYIAAVEAADEAESPGVGALETATKVAIHSFVKGCKNDGIWPAIKASCILAAARTIQGALVPLVKQSADSTPARFGTAGGWNYDRKTGLAANGTDNYINAGRAGNADPQNNSHCAVNVHTANSTGANSAYAGDNASAAGATNIGVTSANAIFFRCRSNASAVGGASATGLLGVSRNSSSAYTYIVSGSTTPATTASDGVSTANMFIFGRNSGAGALAFASNGRINFYSIGESLNLTQLDSRVSALINDIGAAF